MSRYLEWVRKADRRARHACTGWIRNWVTHKRIWQWLPAVVVTGLVHAGLMLVLVFATVTLGWIQEKAREYHPGGFVSPPAKATGESSPWLPGPVDSPPGPQSATIPSPAPAERAGLSAAELTPLAASRDGIPIAVAVPGTDCQPPAGPETFLPSRQLADVPLGLAPEPAPEPVSTAPPVSSPAPQPAAAAIGVPIGPQPGYRPPPRDPTTTTLPSGLILSPDFAVEPPPDPDEVRLTRRPVEPVTLFGLSAPAERVLILLDKSGSMEGRVWDVCREKAITTIEALPEGILFQVVMFHEQVELLGGPGQPDWHKRSRETVNWLRQALTAEKTGTTTVAMPGFEKAFSLDPYVIYFLTDAALDDVKATPDVEKVCAMNAGRATIHTLHFINDGGGDPNYPAAQIATKNRGAYRPIDVNEGPGFCESNRPAPPAIQP